MEPIFKVEIMKLGIVHLVQSAKGTLALLIVGVSGALCFTGHMDGMSCAAAIGTAGTVFMWTHAKQAIAGMGGPSA